MSNCMQVRAAYVETLSRVLSGHFRVYLNSLEPLQVGNTPLRNLQSSQCISHGLG